MIYDPKLETFIRIADAGSFNKASLEVSLSSTALIKQINSLESELDIKLFDRSHKGLKLTKAGESLYKDVKYIMEYSRKALSRAKELMETEKEIIRIGTSPMTSTRILTKLWPELKKVSPNIDIELVPFENTPENASEILRNLGSQIDLVFGIFDKTLLDLRQCCGFEISREPICAALPIDHPLAKKDKLYINDLFGEDVMIIKRGWSHFMDRIRDDLTSKYPKINLIDFDFYSLNIFNKCQQRNDIILVVDNWSEIHPAMKTVPVDWDYTIPYGILHSPHPSKTTQRFLDSLHKVITTRSNL